jgi:hypothetical protein
MAMVEFDSDDAWILWAIPTGEEGIDLRGLIGAADALNHAVPLREQIVLSINRGLRAGLVEVERGRFRFAPERRKDIVEAHGVSTTWLRQLDALSSYLASREWPAISRKRYRLSRERYSAVVERYLITF